MKRSPQVAVLCLLTSAALAQTGGGSASGLIWKPPRIRATHVVPKSTIRKIMVGTVQVSNMKIVLEETKMTDVQARFGGEIGAEGDAGDSLAWLCLRGRDEAGPWALWLESGEMDADSVGSFQWRRVAPDRKFDPRCQRLKDDDSRVRLPISLRLGLSETDLLQTLGPPTIREGNTLLFEHDQDLVIHDEPYTEQNTVIVVMRNGAIWAIEVSKLTSS
jgi:hypothetical protein